MIDRMVFPVTLERLITSEGIGVVDRALAGLGLNMMHQFLRGDTLHHVGVDPSIPLQQAEYDTFARRSPASLALASTAKVSLVEFDLPPELAALQLPDVVEDL